MRALDFVKAHGLGNDFIIVDCLHGELQGEDLSALSLRLCDRHFGIGADGLVLVHPSSAADYRMQIMNSDGSEAEMCGNATRCFANYLYLRGMAGKDVAIETLSGVKKVAVSETDAGLVYTANVGPPSLEAQDVPVTGLGDRVVNQPIEVGGVPFEITCVAVGNPHCVIFMDDVSDIPIETWGPRIETHSAFPRKINVEFAQIVSPEKVIVRVWERGAGLTLACGTGSCATLVAGQVTGRLGRKGTFRLPGGELLIEWREDDNLYMTGPAQEVFKGTISI